MSGPRVILHLIESYGPGGAETVILELCKRMDRTAYYPIVGLLKEGWLKNELEKNNIETIVFSNKHSFDPSFLYSLIKTIRKKKVSLVHSHEFMMNVYGTTAAFICRKPGIATVHGKNYFWKKARRRAAYRLTSRLASSIVAVSEDSKDFLSCNAGIEKSRIRVVYNAVDPDRYLMENTEKARITDGIKSPVIGSVGNLYPVKGYTYLLKAAAKVIGTYPDAAFIIAGKMTEYSNDLMQEARDLGIDGNIRFLGFREDIPGLLKLMDLFVLPSIEESFSIATIEALAASLPVIATRCGGPEEIIEHGKTGILVPKCDPPALCEAMLKLLKDRELAQRLAKAGSAMVRERFSMEAMIGKYMGLYNEFIGGSDLKQGFSENAVD